jgi:hypothetical protein
MVEELVREAYRRIAPAKLSERLDVPAAASRRRR